MSDEARQWSRVAGKLRRALGLAPPSWKEADAEMVEAEAFPMTDTEILQIAGGETAHQERDDYELDADYTWANEYANDDVAEDMLVLNREGGEEDTDVDKRVEEHRKEALRDDDKKDDDTRLEGD